MSDPNTFVVNDPNPLWPGALLQLPDGRWIAAYERVFSSGRHNACVRVTSDLFGTWGSEIQVSDGVTDSYDPGVQLDPDGLVVVTWKQAGNQAHPGIMVAVLDPDSGTVSRRQPLFVEDPGWAFDEQSTSRVGDRTRMVYTRRLGGTTDKFDVVRRDVLSGLRAGPLVTVAPKATADSDSGPFSNKRCTLDGEPAWLVAAWNTDGSDTQPRDIWGADSVDGGATWSPSRLLLSAAGKDHYNPFPIRIAPNDLRVYAACNPSVVYVKSTDGGATWGPRTTVPALTGTGYGRFILARTCMTVIGTP